MGKKEKTENVSLEEHFEKWIKNKSIDAAARPEYNSIILAQHYIAQSKGADTLAQMTEEELQELYDKIRPIRNKLVGHKG